MHSARNKNNVFLLAKHFYICSTFLTSYMNHSTLKKNRHQQDRWMKLLQGEEQMANECTVFIAIVINPGVSAQSYVDPVSLFQFEVHPISSGLMAVTCSMIEYHHNWLLILAEDKPHPPCRQIMTREAEVVDSFHWCSEDACGQHNRTQSMSLNTSGAQSGNSYQECVIHVPVSGL